MELKANEPFKSAVQFEETMQMAVETVNDFIDRKYKAHLLGTGMHPFLHLEETGLWTHGHRRIYGEYERIFNLKQHGWLNIQSFHLNLPYAKEKDGILLHNLLANICPYLPAVAASSPICEGVFGSDVDNRLKFYKINQREIPAITADVVPEYASSFDSYRKEVIERYSTDLAEKGAAELILHKEWVNSRGVIFRFDRRALEIRIMDEQECIKSDVALSCFVRSLLRGWVQVQPDLLPHTLLVSDFNCVLRDGLAANVRNPHGRTARNVCLKLLNVAWKHATQEEKKYLPLIQRRIDEGNLSEVIRQRIQQKAQRTSLKEAIVNVYSTLISCLAKNEPYF